MTNANTTVIEGKSYDEPIVLDKPGEQYVLDGAVDFFGSGFIVAAEDITLNLLGYPVTFNTGGSAYRYGVVCPPWWNNHPAAMWRESDITVWKRVKNFHITDGDIIQSDRKHSVNNVGILSYKTDGIRISKMQITISGEDTSGIVICQCGGIEIHNNHIRDETSSITNRHQGRACIDLQFVKGAPKIVGNILNDCSQWGIRITRASDHEGQALIKDNTIEPESVVTNGYGIGVHAADVAVLGNTICATTGMGIHLNEQSIRAIVRKNIVSICCPPSWDEYPRMNAHALALERCESALIEDNSFTSYGSVQDTSEISNGCAVKIGVNPCSENIIKGNSICAEHLIGPQFSQHPLIFASAICITDHFGASGCSVIENKITTNDRFIHFSSWLGEAGEQIDASGFLLKDNKFIRDECDETTGYDIFFGGTSIKNLLIEGGTGLGDNCYLGWGYHSNKWVRLRSDGTGYSGYFEGELPGGVRIIRPIEEPELPEDWSKISVLLDGEAIDPRRITWEIVE